jgi:hypothetical protein
LFNASTTASLFTVSDTRTQCAITQYLLFKTSTEALTSADTELYARLDGSNYADDGAINIQTNIDAAFAEKDVEFFIKAQTSDGAEAIAQVTVTLSCIDVTSITTTYAGNNSANFIQDYTADGFFFKIFISELSTSETVDVFALTTYATDRPIDCFVTGLDLVTDAEGATAYTGSVFTK